MSAARHIGRAMRRLPAASGGAAAVEFVLVLPVLALLLFGTIDLGRLLADYQVAGQGIRDAARYLSRADPAALGIDCASGVIDENSPPALAAMNLAMTGTIDGSGGYVLGYWTNSVSLAAAGLTVSVLCEDNGGGAFGGLYDSVPMVPSLRMSAAIPFPLLNGWLLGRGGTLTFTVHHRQPHVGGRWGI
ncbi:MAG TPA: TadE/TadG family type IV pilus assembly protein [Kiloniellales bacterium]|jgi:Flp pilus assembly protein TadG